MSNHAFRRWIAFGFMLLLAAGFSLTVLPVQAQIVGTNWKGNFYNNTTLSGTPVATDVDYPTGICFNWGTNAPTAGSNQQCSIGAPINGIEADNFSAVFTSTQELSEEGVYLFTLRFNDGMRFYIDGELVYDNFIDAPIETGFAVVGKFTHFLTDGNHEFKAEYVEFTGMSLVQIQWGLVPDGSMTPTPAPENELLRNNGFEGALVGDNQGETFPWSVPAISIGVDNVRCNKLEIEKVFAHTGDCAFRFSASLDRDSQIRQNADLSAVTFATGDSLDFSFWLNAKKASASGTARVIVKYSDDTEPTHFSLDLGQTDGYELIEQNIPLVSAAVSKIRVQFKNTSPAGKIFLDDVSLLLISGGGSAVLPLPLSPPSGLTGSQP